MDSNNRVEQLESDLKLLKNEIKQVLLEIQEHVLNAQNPFTITASGFAAGQKRDATEHIVSTQPSASTLAMETVESAASTEEQSQAGKGASTPPQEKATGPQAEAPGAASAPRLDAPAQPGGHVQDAYTQGHYHAGPGSEAFIAAGPGQYPQGQVGQEAFAGYGGSEAASQPQGPQPFVVGAGPGPEVLLQRRHSGARQGQPGAEGRPTGEETQPELEANTSARPADKAPRGAARKREGIDLVTIAGLAQWTDKVLRRVGRANLETLIELSQKTGRLSADHREVLLTFVQLFDNKEGGHTISARQMVSVLAQLEGLLGNASTDARLMSFLLQDSLEESPLIQP